jgi:hypothetical protein
MCMTIRTPMQANLTCCQKQKRIYNRCIQRRYCVFTLQSQLETELVVGQLHAPGKFPIDIGMQSQLMADMGEIGFIATQPGGELHCFIERKMGKMFLFSKCIDNENAAAADLVLFFGIDPVGIGDISEWPEPKSEHRHAQMPDSDRLHGYVADMEWLVGDGMQGYLRHAGVTGISKRIWEFPDQHFLCHFIGIDAHRHASEKVKGAYVIQPGYMILVRMSEKYGIEMPYIGAQHLKTKIRSGIYDKRGFFGLNENAGAKAAVTFVLRPANPAGTADHGNSPAGARSQNGDREGWTMHIQM